LTKHERATIDSGAGLPPALAAQSCDVGVSPAHAAKLVMQASRLLTRIMQE
jgi:hypothetical protein